MKRRNLFVCLWLLMPVQAFAQPTNGNFSSGPIGWNWKRGVSDTSFPPCNAVQFSADNDNTPDIGTPPASGRVAQLSGPVEHRDGVWYKCEQIEQVVSIPVGSQIRFDAKIGVVLGTSSQPAREGSLILQIISNNQLHTLRILQGRSQNPDCSVNNVCPKFITYTEDVSQFGGQNVTLIFRLQTSIYNAGWATQASSPAFIDNVSFQPAPPPPPTAPPTPSFPAPQSVVKQPYVISWGSSTGANKYILEQETAAGEWASVYAGPNRSWTVSNASPGLYRYRVKACANAACSAPSVVRSFQVVARLESIINYLMNDD